MGRSGAQTHDTLAVLVATAIAGGRASIVADQAVRRGGVSGVLLLIFGLSGAG